MGVRWAWQSAYEKAREDIIFLLLQTFRVFSSFKQVNKSPHFKFFSLATSFWAPLYLLPLASAPFHPSPFQMSPEKKTKSILIAGKAREEVEEICQQLNGLSQPKQLDYN